MFFLASFLKPNPKKVTLLKLKNRVGNFCLLVFFRAVVSLKNFNSNQYPKPSSVLLRSTDEALAKESSKWQELYLYLNHEAPLPTQLHNIAINIHSAFGIQPLQHGIDSYVRPGAPNASTATHKRSCLWRGNGTSQCHSERGAASERAKVEICNNTRWRDLLWGKW